MKKYSLEESSIFEVKEFLKKEVLVFPQESKNIYGIRNLFIQTKYLNFKEEKKIFVKCLFYLFEEICEK